MMETWHPLGPVGVISAFNFPVAVWAWNFTIAAVCGDPVIWKPSEKTPITALACQRLWESVAGDYEPAPEHLSQVAVGPADVGEALVRDPRVPLISATGSCRMGRSVAPVVAARLGRCLLELGGNNGMIVAPSADLELAVRSIVFAAAGTAGQRCTTLRRLIVHESIADEVVARLKKVFDGLPVGNPLDEGTLVGPLVDERAFDAMQGALAQAKSSGGTVHGGGRVTAGVPAGGFYVQPALVEIAADAPILQQETFAPILYVMRYEQFEQAIEIHNGVPQGLASAIFTSDVREAELFCSPAGSDCGIVNVNIGTSGEKETGGGRESGSDAWRNYMRRTTNTVNYGTELPLAQGIKFDA